jgi:MSHA biogenesis protein MshM
MAMYLNYFGLNEEPFQLQVDEKFFLNASNFSEALSLLYLGISEADCFLKVTGEVGTGKTFLCNKLRCTLGGHFFSLYINCPCADEMELFCHIAKQLQIKVKKTDNKFKLMDAIFEKFKLIKQENKKIVLLIDEAQSMDETALEALRLLNYRDSQLGALFHVVLFGQTELDWKLAHPLLRALSQRILFSFDLKPMNFTVLKKYVNHRLQVAGYQGDNLITTPALWALFYATKGVPRLINVVCHKALLMAYRDQTKKVHLKHMIQAIRNTQSVAASSVRPLFGSQMFSQVALLVSSILGVALLGLMFKFI